MEEPIYSEQISAGTRVYYADVRLDKKGQKYMTITEIPTGSHPSQVERQRIFIHSEIAEEFAQMLAECVSQLKK